MTERFDEILDEAQLLRELDAARAEVWVSGLVAEWGDTDDLLARLRACRAPAAIDVACALAAIEPAASEVARSLVDAGAGTLPPWAAGVGTAQAEQAWEIVDPFSGNVSVVVELVDAVEARHSMLVEIEDALAVDIHFGPPGLVEDAFDESETRSLSVTELPVADALARMRDALARTAEHADPPVTDEYVMNLPLADARLAGAPSGGTGADATSTTGSPHAADAPGTSAASGAPGAPAAAAAAVPARPPRDPDDAEADAAAAATLRAALAGARLDRPAPATVAAAAAAVRASLAAHDAGDLEALAADTGLSDPQTLDDATLLASLAGAFVVPGALAAFSPGEREAIRGLEWADWLGAVIPLVRGGAGTDATPLQLVRNINRCPEVTTTVPKRDVPVVAGIFALTLHAWELTGVIDAESRLTDLGAWLLPRALLHAWGDAPAGSGKV